MAKVNPETPTVQPDNFLGYSKGWRDDTVGTMFEGVAKLVDGYAKGTDEVNKINIKDEVYKGVDATNKDVGVDASMKDTVDMFSDPSKKKVPGELEIANANFTTLRKAFAEGKISPMYYWSRLEANTKSLRARYPGYRAEIDQMISGITGNTPANAIRTELFKQAAKLAEDDDSEAKAKRSFISTNADELSRAYPGVPFKDLYSKPFYELQEKVGGQKAEDGQNARDKAAIERETAQGTLDKRKAVSSATDMANKSVFNMLHTFTTSVGGFEDIQKKVLGVANGTIIDPKDIEATKNAIVELEMRMRQRLSEDLNSPLSKGSKNTYNTVIADQAEIKNIIENAMAPFTALKDAYLNDKTGLVSAQLALVEQMKNGDIANFYRNTKPDDPMRKDMLVKNIYGVDAMNAFIAGTGGWSSRQRALATMTLSKTVSQPDTVIADPTKARDTVGTVIDAAKNSGMKNGDDFMTIIKSNVGMITAPTTDPRTAASVAVSMFGGDQKDKFLARINKDNRAQVFQMMTGEAVHQAMLKIKDSEPQVFGAYRDFIIANASNLVRENAADIQVGIEYRKYINVTWDAAKGKFSYNVDPSFYNVDTSGFEQRSNFASTPIIGGVYDLMERGIRGSAYAVRDVAEKYLTGAATASIDKVNKILEPMVRVAEVTGEDPTKLLDVLMRAQGVNPNAEKKPGDWYRLDEIIGEAISAAGSEIAKAGKGFLADSVASMFPESSKMTPSNFKMKGKQITNELEGTNPELIRKVQQVFTNLGVPDININSAYRDAEHNAKVGGAKHSEHINGNAIDIDTSKMTIQEQKRLIKALSMAGITGIGVYGGSIHVDMGNRRAWGPSYGRETVPGWAEDEIKTHETFKASKK